MSDIVVDTYKLKSYAERLGTANARIVKLDIRLDGLYWDVGLKGLYNLIQADALTGFSWRILRCKDYLSQTAADFEKIEKKLLEEDPLDFSKPPMSDIQEVFYDVGVGVKKTIGKVKSFAEETLTSIIYSYDSHGFVYKAVQYGKAVYKGIKGVVKIVGGVAALLGSSGVSAPVSILMIISGGNDFYNAIMDGSRTYVGEYDKVGKTNALRDLLTENAGEIGAYFGDRKAGEIFGKFTYYGMDLVTSLAALDISLDKIKQLSTTNYGQLGSELKEIANLDISKIWTTDLETLRYEVKLAGYTFKETAKFVTAAKVFKGVIEDAYKVGKNVDKFLSVGAPEGWKNPVIEYIDNLSDIESKIGTGAKILTKARKLVMG